MYRLNYRKHLPVLSSEFFVFFQLFCVILENITIIGNTIPLESFKFIFKIIFFINQSWFLVANTIIYYYIILCFIYFFEHISYEYIDY